MRRSIVTRVGYGSRTVDPLRAACVASVSSLLLATPVLAAGQAAEGRTLEEVLVTATKRGEAQNVQDVPIAVTAFGAEQLQSLNFQNLQSLTYTIPNVQLETIGTIAGYQNFSIRGLGINSSIPSIDPTVGVFVDGVYMGINAGILFDNFDVEGIEVLRGPQGILFGRNVTGGAVLLRTRTPQFEPEFAARAGVEEGLNYVADFSVTGPLISDQLAAKLAVYYNDDQGWFKNLYDGKEYGATQQWIVRPAFRWTPTEALDLVLRLEHGQRDGEGSASQNHAIFSRDSFDFVINDRGFSDDEWSHAFLEANWRVPFGDGTVTNVFGWREFEGSSLIDVDGTANTAFHGGFYTDQSQYSNELRYAGMFGPLSLTAGLYYFTQDLFYIENRTLAGGATRVIGGGTQDSSVQGVFAAGDWALTETVTLNLGARYTYEEKDAKVSLIRPGGCDLAAKTCTFTFADDQSWNDVSPRIGLQWQPTQETQVYGFWAKGFRSGGYNMRQTAAANTPGPFDAEEQSSFEVGIKQDFPVGARLNLAAFHNTIENIQREINLPGPLGVAQLITNVGELEIKGAELEAEMRLAAGLVVAAQAGYTHGKYTELDFDLNGDGVIDGLDFDLKPPRLSPWTYGASVAYQFGLGSLGSLASRISFNHRDANFYTDNNRGVLNEFDDLGANFTFRPSGDGPWSIAVYGRNLLNKTSFGGDTQLPDVAGFAGDGPAGPRPPATFSPLNKGRVIGAELRVKF